ncbi:MAG: TIGR00153 family protein [Nitrospirae bacterium]|nr:TIGR00153 family protein [Nitrospirota bacterium]
MGIEKMLFGGKAEQQVLEKIKTHIRILWSASDCFHKAFEERDRDLVQCVPDLEREGDSVRREIVSKIYEGAFLPFLRSSICRFVEIVDEAFDVMEDAAYEFENLNLQLDEEIEEDCIKIADTNAKMCEMLLIAFEALFGKGDLREKNLAVRIYEKKVDEIKFDLLKKLRKIEIKNFWEGKTLADFVSYLTHVSDVIEDASDYLTVIKISLK